jgi:POT family proton-dependent oligopeptide transporter
VFLVLSLLMYLPEGERAHGAKDVFHTFVIGVYFFPLLGGWLAIDSLANTTRSFGWPGLLRRPRLPGDIRIKPDRLLRRPRAHRPGVRRHQTVCSGIRGRSVRSNEQAPRQSGVRFVLLDYQFRVILRLASDADFLRSYGARIAFGIPGVLMFIATVVLWVGRKQYVMVPPARTNPDSFLNVCRTAIVSGTGGRVLAIVGVAAAIASFLLMPKFGFAIAACLALVAVIAFGGLGVWLQLETARGKHPDEAIEGVRAVLRVLVLFALVTPFWSLFDQKASTWVFQANAMTKPEWFQASQMQALNPALVMLLIPFNNLVLYPVLRRFGYEMTALRRMTAGIAFSGLSWIVVGAMQLALDGGNAFSITWQVLPYALLTFGEVLVSATGLEFAYSQAPPAMKSAIMAFCCSTSALPHDKVAPKS